jgi:DNA-binding MarR family transcriptional regulator
VHASDQLTIRLHRHLLLDSGLTATDYKILAGLSEHPAGRMPAQELCSLLQWEKSRLSHQARRMEEQGLIVREPNPADARSVMVCLLPAGRRAIEEAAPLHVKHVRQHMIDLFTPAELDTLAALNERVLRHLAEEPFSE